MIKENIPVAWYDNGEYQHAPRFFVEKLLRDDESTFSMHLKEEIYHGYLNFKKATSFNYTSIGQIEKALVSRKWLLQLHASGNDISFVMICATVPLIGLKNLLKTLIHSRIKSYATKNSLSIIT